MDVLAEFCVGYPWLPFSPLIHGSLLRGGGGALRSLSSLKPQPNDALIPVHEAAKTSLDPDWKATHLFFTNLPDSKALTEIEIWIDMEKKACVAKFGVGLVTVGNKGIVHGGLLCTMLDEMMGATLDYLGLAPAGTAYLHTTFRRVVTPGATLYGHASVSSVEGRKRFMKSQLMESISPPLITAEATSLFVAFKK